MKSRNLPSLTRLKTELARRHLADFIQATFPGYRLGWVHNRIAEISENFLEDIERRRSPRVIITAPPQHGKSEIVSRRLPAFALGRNPNLRIILASYSADRATDFSGDVQRIIDSRAFHEIFPDTRIVGEYAKAGEARRTAGLFQVVGRLGRMRSAGVGGGITGESADALIVDDPLKDFSEAVSETTRESVWNWLTSTAFTRLQEGAGVLMMMTRWHQDDPIGRLLERQPGFWKVFNFQAIAEEDEPPYRLRGEALAPELHSLESLIAIRDGGATSSYMWESLYMQRPGPLGGGIFKRDDWQRIKLAEMPKCSEYLQSWDCAFKDLRSSDYVVGQVWGVLGAGRYLLDQIRGHLTFSRTQEAIRQMSAKWPQATRKLVEDKANGTAVIDTLKNEIPGLIPIQPEGGKEARAHAVSAFVEAHNVYIPIDAPWADAFIEEAAQFPNGAHDDQVDAATQALNYLSNKRVRLVTVAELEMLQAATEGRLAPSASFADDLLNKKPCDCIPAPARRGTVWVCPQCGLHWRAEPGQPPPKGQRRGIFAGELSGKGIS